MKESPWFITLFITTLTLFVTSTSNIPDQSIFYALSPFLMQKSQIGSVN